jgi:6-pyruvoyl-tetrahydropterin synthase
VNDVFSVTVSDHMMVAHSLRGAVFGPAQRLHGATYVVQATFRAAELDENGIVLDIGIAGERLHALVGTLTHDNLDDHPRFRGVNTTTEVLARYLADELADAARAGELGPAAARLSGIAVILHESPAASAGYERVL